MVLDAFTKKIDVKFLLVMKFYKSENVFLVSHTFMLFHLAKCSWNKLQNVRNSENICHFIPGTIVSKAILLKSNQWEISETGGKSIKNMKVYQKVND